jgi:hypothetical protein
MGAGREDFGEHRYLQSSFRQLQSGAQTGTTGTDHHGVVFSYG